MALCWIALLTAGLLPLPSQTHVNHTETNFVGSAAVPFKIQNPFLPISVQPLA